MALQLTFRGIPFYWEERGGETTPRFAEHDVPQRRGRWHENMGDGPQVYTVDGFLLAPTTALVRAELLILQRACRNQRAGTLYHPIYGAVTVVCKTFKWKESIEKLNRIDLDLTFEDDDGPNQPMATRSIGAALASAVSAAAEAIGEGLDQVWDLVEMPAYAIDEAEAGMAEVAAGILLQTQLLGSAVQTAIAAPLALMTAVPLVTSALSLPIISAFSAFTTDSNGNPLQLTSDQANTTALALTSLAAFTLAAEPANTASRAIVAQALAGLSATVRRLALLQLANLTRQMNFVSSNDAITTRNTISDLMGVEILAAADDASTNSNPVSARISRTLSAARAEMVTDLTTRAASLVPVGTIKLPQTTPAITAAYALYGDGDGSAGARANTIALITDFCQRNAVQDPGQVPGGVPLEYLASTPASSP